MLTVADMAGKWNPDSGGQQNGVSSDVESEDEKFESSEEEILYLARNGKETKLLQLLIDNEELNEECKLNINCKGTHKSNRGWTPLHLAAYFGQTTAVRVLLEFGAAVNVLNSCGESPLHLAAYTGREEAVGLLLQHGAETGVLNTRGQKPRDVAKKKHIINMIDAADNTANLQLESEFLQAAVTGDSEELSALISHNQGLNINTQDLYGNSALHLAAMRGHGAAAVVLLQHSIDVDLRNKSGQTAFDMAQNPKIKQVLGLQPIKTIQSQPQRFEGTLLKKSRFVGFKQMWVVLDRGVLSYFQNRGDASTGSRRKGVKYLDEAKVINTKENPGEIKLEYSDGSKHTLHLESLNGSQMTLQKWLNALQEHIAFSTHYIHQGQGVADDTAEDIVSLGTMQGTLQNAQAHRGHLDKEVETLKNTIEQISNYLARETPKGSGKSITQADLRLIATQASDILKTSQDMYQALNHSMALISQQEELRYIQLKEEKERCRMLQDSLHALATEHHELEKSLSRRQSFLSSMDEEFFDCDDEEVFGSPVVDNFADATSQDGEADQLYHPKSGATSSYGSSDKSVDSRRIKIVAADFSRDSSHASAERSYLELAQGPLWNYRTSLPVPMFSRSDFSFWSILKQCIGKELSKITMPVVFNEPLSFIQRLAEYMEYAPLIEQAAKCDDPIERMELIAAFAVSALSSNWERIGKPFNPLLGETYELDRPDLGFRYIGEQVSHHPPVTAFHAEGKQYAFHGSIQPKLKFWGKTVEINPKGTVVLTLHRYRETYTWQNVNCVIHNVIVGSLWVEHHGIMEITNNKTNIKAVLNFKQSGWFGKDLHHVEGFVYRGKVKERALYGTWVLGLYSCNADAYERYTSDPDIKARLQAKDKKDDAKAMNTFNYEIPGQKTLWKMNPRPPHSADYYHFSLFAMSLNELLPGMNDTLPPTDSRFRPDIRNMEDGRIDQSADEKNRVEEKQREARKDRKKKNSDWVPRWFTPQKLSSGKEEWIFNSAYWQRNWRECADIF